MSQACAKVHVIVAADYGESLRSLPSDEPVWVADTSINKPIIKSIWAARTAVPRGGITSFKVAPDGTPEDWLLGILDMVELHHGEHSQKPPFSALRVTGASLSTHLRVELEEWGFHRFEDSTDGFVAYR